MANLICKNCFNFKVKKFKTPNEFILTYKQYYDNNPPVVVLKKLQQQEHIVFYCVLGLQRPSCYLDRISKEECDYYND